MEPGYYRYIKPLNELEEDGCEIGQLWYLLNVYGDVVEAVRGSSTWEFNFEDFEDCFEFAPEGLMERQNEFVQATNEMHQIGSKADTLRIATSHVPAIEMHSEKPEDVEFSTETQEPIDPGTEISVPNTKDLATVKTNIKRSKSLAARVKKQVAKKQTALKEFMEEQAIILRAKTHALSKVVKQAEQAIYVLNAYLGQDEEIIQIADGEPAPADTKIVMRQLVLFMDEECAAANNLAKRGGIDFQNINEFGEWVCNPDHLKQVLPEEKGVVAIKPRRNEKFYSDNPLENQALNRENKCLYILIRNGEKLFRIYTTLWLQDVFFPRKDEFEHHFYDRWDRDKKYRPGSKAYMQAMEAVEDDQRRYYTVLILLQGLLDRTKVFEPIPETAARINLLNLHESEKHVTFLYDAEMILGDGRPSYSDWHEEANSTIDIGCRVILEDAPYPSEHDRKRIYPKYARRPDLLALHRIEKRDDEEGWFKFYYSREGETVYHGWGDFEGQPAKNRASYLIDVNDPFVLNFDAVTIEEMEYYLNSRLHRHEYENMVPLMKRAIELKKEEAKAEAPFCQLLIGEIIKKHKVSIDEAETRIDELIKWWKFKNRNHRALSEDDAKAIRMIVSEFGKRQKLDEASDRLQKLHDDIVEQLRDSEPNSLSIWHKKDNQYAVYLWHNDRNVFVTEEIWELKKHQLSCVSQKEWKVVDARHEGWNCLWKHDRWDEWEIGALANDHLTDPELVEAFDFGLKAVADLQFYENNRDKKGRLWRVPLCAMLNTSGNVKIYFLKRHAYIPKKNILSDSANTASIGMLQVNWEKKRTGVTHRIKNQSNHVIEWGNLPWSEDFDDRYRRGEPLYVHKVYEKNIEKARAENEKVMEFRREVRKLTEPLRNLNSQVREAMIEVFYREEKEKFDEQYFDEDGDLWEDHKEELKKPEYPRWVNDAAALLVERNIDVNGMSLEEMVSKAKKFEFEFRSDFEEDWFNKVKDFVLEVNPVDIDDDDDFDEDW